MSSCWQNVVVDKPFTETATQAEELIQIARHKGQRLTVFHNRRWDCDFQTIRKILSKKMLGNIYSYETHFHRFRPTVRNNRWKESAALGNGTLYDLGSHLIDQAFQLFGEPDEIIPDTIPQRPGPLLQITFI
jgi:scyllo-inositol 2-dehydrogenase (NADP+)